MYYIYVNIYIKYAYTQQLTSAAAAAAAPYMAIVE